MVESVLITKFLQKISACHNGMTSLLAQHWLRGLGLSLSPGKRGLVILHIIFPLFNLCSFMLSIHIAADKDLDHKQREEL